MNWFRSAKKEIPPEKRGEINELKEALSDPNVDKDLDKKRELLQRVINYATMGIDTTKLFDKVILVFTKLLIIVRKHKRFDSKENGLPICYPSLTFKPRISITRYKHLI